MNLKRHGWFAGGEQFAEHFEYGFMATASEQTAPLDSNHSESPRRSRFKADPLVMGIIVALLLTVVQRVVGLVRSLLFCRMLPDEELGQWSLVYSFLIFFAPLMVLGLPGSFGRYVEHYRQRGQLRSFLARICGFSLLLTIVAAIAMIVAGDQFSWFVFGNTHQGGDILLLAFVLVIVIWHNLLAELLESLRQIRRVAWMRFTSSIVFATVSIGCVIFHGPYVSSLVVGYVAGFAVGSIPGIAYLLRNRPSSEAADQFCRSSMWRKVLPYAGWIWAINALTNLFGLADRYMLLHFSSADNEVAQSAVGQYHSGMVIPMLLSNLAVLITGALMPYMAAAWEKNDREESGRLLRTTLKLSAIGFTAGGLVLIVMGPFLFNTLLQGRYDEGMSLLPIAFAYYTWFALGNICLTYLWCAERGWNSAIALAIGLAVNMGLNIVLIPTWGIHGAVTATMIANGIALALIYLLSWINGWRIDFGVVATSMLPLALLTDVLTASCVVLCLVALVVNGNRILDAKEKEHFQTLLNRVREKATSLFARLS